MTVLKDLPPAPAAGEPDATAPVTGIAEELGAVWMEETIRTDAWNYELRVRNRVLGEMLDRASPEARRRFNQMRRRRAPGADRAAEQVLFRDLGAPRPAGDPVRADVPTSAEALETEVDRRRRAELAEAQEILGRDGPSPVTGFIGAGARAMTDPVSLALLPLGGAGGGIARMAAREAVLGAAGEAAILPREMQTTEELGVAPPDPLARIATGAALGGGLGAAAGAIGRFGEYRRRQREAAEEQRPEGAEPTLHEDEIEAERARLAGDPAANEPAAAADGDAGAEPAMADFEFGTGGNASPRKNRVGYVFGRLLERGYEPHVAAGLVGNLMQESGVGLNPRAVGDGGNAFGIAQWNGPRRRQYMEFARRRGTDPANLDTQIAFLDHEMRNSEAAAARRIRSATTAREAALVGSREFWRPGVPHNARRAGYAQDLIDQFEAGRVPRWRGSAPTPQAEMPAAGGTARGFTGTNSVTTGDGTSVDIEPVVMDAQLLRPASGDLQPRDRSRMASDEQIAEIAARLDPARLMPSPEADRGAPVVGPDGVIESGNARVRAVLRAAERHPDRYEAYLDAVRASGAEMPEDAAVPIMVARRRSDMTDAERRRFVVEANTPAVARMSATERARADAGALDEDTVRLFEPAASITAPANRQFVRRALDTLPQTERAALVDGTGALNAEGARRLTEAMFARAWDAPDILARFTETDAGELRSLIDALREAAPAFAALRADIAAGAVRPEMDIGPFVTDAMRLIASARELAAQEGLTVASAVAELIDDVDLLEGVLSPVTAALVRKFWSNGRAAPKDRIAEFLTRYADEARRIGTTQPGLLGDAPGPLDALRAIDPDAFGDIVELGAPRGVDAADAAAPVADADTLPARAFDDGALSPEAQAADAIAFDELRETVAPEQAPATGAPTRQAADSETREALTRARDELGDIVFDRDDGTTIRASELLDEIEADATLADVIDSCATGRGG